MRLLATLPLALALALTASARESGTQSVAPLPDHEYAEGTLPWAEIHRRLPDIGIVTAYEAAMHDAGLDSAERRAAQLELLRMVRADPIELFRQLRSELPVLELPDLGMYLVTRDRDVREILHNPTVFAVRDYRDRMEPVVGPYMLNRDAHPYYNLEEKPWMRSLMRRSDLARVRRVVREATRNALAEGTSLDGTIDLVPSVGRGVPVRMVQEYFGFRAPTIDLLRWSYRTQDSFFHNVAYVRGWRGFLIRRLGIGGPRLQAAQIEALRVHEAAFRAGEEMRAYLDRYVREEDARIRAEDTVLSRMIRVNDRLAHPKEMDRIRSNVMGGLIGAVETSNAAIVQSLNQLLRRPAILAEARAAARAVRDEDAIERTPFADYVWEALRFHPINPFVVRYVTEDTWIGTGDQAMKLRNGRRVLVATHSAMQDPRAVRDPDAFVAERPFDDREMNLGYAHHRCLGDFIAEVMVPEVLRQIVLLPSLERVPEDPPAGENQGIDFGDRGSFPERFVVRHRRSP